MMPYAVSLLAVSMYDILYAIAFGQPCVFKRHSSRLTVSFNPCRTRKCMVDPSSIISLPCSVYKKTTCKWRFNWNWGKETGLLSRAKSRQKKEEWATSAPKWSQIYLKCTPNGPQMYPIKFQREQEVRIHQYESNLCSVCWVWGISSSVCQHSEVCTP